MNRNRILSFVFLFLSIATILSLFYYVNGSFPKFLYEAPNFGLSAHGTSGAMFWRPHATYAPYTGIELILFFTIFFLTLFGIGFHKKSNGQEWHIIKKDGFANKIAYGVLISGTLTFVGLWAVEQFGLAWIIFIPFATISFLFLSSTDRNVKIVPPADLPPENLEDSIYGLNMAKNIFRVIAIIIFIISVLVLIDGFLINPPQGDLAGIGYGAIFLFASFIIFIGVIMLILSFYFKHKENQIKGDRRTQGTTNNIIVP